MSMTQNKHLTLLFVEDNDLISAKSADKILILNLGYTLHFLNFLYRSFV